MKEMGTKDLIFRQAKRKFLFRLLFFEIFLLSACSITAVRPIQEMSDTDAAIRAAKEVKADVLAPELYRQAREWFQKARREYKFKNFLEAKEYALKARSFAEQAEFDSVRGGAQREVSIPDPYRNLPDTAESAPPPSTPPEKPSGIFVESYEEQMAKQREQEKEAAAPEKTE